MTRIISALTIGALLLAAPLTAGIDEALEHFKKGDYATAAAYLRKVVEANPEHRRARYYLGLSLLEEKHWDEATQQFRALEEAGEGEPAPEQVKVGLARAAMGNKDWDAADAALDEALVLNADSPEVYLRLGELYLHQENYRMAVEPLEKAIQLDPKLAYAYYYAGIAYSNLKRQDKMVDYFRIFRKLAPNAPEGKKVDSLLRSVR